MDREKLAEALAELLEGRRFGIGDELFTLRAFAGERGSVVLTVTDSEDDEFGYLFSLIEEG